MKAKRLCLFTLSATMMLAGCGQANNSSTTTESGTSTTDTSVAASSTPATTSNPTTSTPSGTSSESTSSTPATPTVICAVTSVALVNENGVVKFTVSGTYDSSVTMKSPVVKVTSDANTTATKESFSGDIATDAAAHTWSATLDLTTMVESSWHDIKIYFDGTSETATSEIDKTALSDAMYNQTADVYTNTKKRTYGFNNYNNLLKLLVVTSDLYAPTAASISADASGVVTFALAGTVDSHLVADSAPVVKISSSSDPTVYSGAISVDMATGTFTALVVITAMNETSWHGIKLYFNSTSEPDGSDLIKGDWMSDASYQATTAVTSSTGITSTFAFQNWNNILMVSVTLKDSLVTSFASLHMEVGSDGAYLHLIGTNTHQNAQFVIGPESTPLATVDVASTGAFDAAVRVDNLFSSSVSKLDIRFFYTISSGESQHFEITDAADSLGDTKNLQGVSYGGYNYVITKDNGGSTRYFKVKRNQDGFSMDSAILSSDATTNKASLLISGTINLTNSITLGTVTFQLENSTNSFAIAASDIDANGYLYATIDITNMVTTSAVKDTDAGAMAIFNDTSKLNNFWAGDWSHGNDVLTTTVNGYTYQITGGQWGKYCLDKVTAA